MATLQKRKVNGNYYWYIVESRRVNGKPRPVVLSYLGKMEDLLKRLSGETPFEISSKSHGATQVLWELAKELQMAEIINRNISQVSGCKIPVRDNCTVGESLLFAAIGRACKPTSKLAWYDWCKDTSLEHIVKKSLKKLNSQHFWDQMDGVPVEAIPQIEKEIIQALSQHWQLSTEELFFDTTNFFTFIASDNQRCKIPKRGHNKQKRRDLRQISLALVVTGKEHIPLFHHLYDGNKNDITAFKENLPNIVTRLRDLSLDFKKLTLIFDKGNNSKQNFAAIPDSINFIGSLSPAHFRPLVEDANKKLEKFSIDGQEFLAYKTPHEVWGKSRPCVVFISDELFSGQLQGIYQALDKATKSLNSLQLKLQNTKHRYSQEKLSKIVNTLVDAQYLRHILKAAVLSQNSKLSLRYWVDLDELSNLKDNILGRQLLVTSHTTWSAGEIIRGYQRKTKIEYAFRCLKDRDHLSLRPQYHWTDQKITVHAFICFLAFLLATLAFAKARKHSGYQHDISNFLDDLDRIRLASVIRNPSTTRGKPKVSHKLEVVPPPLRPLVAAFNIHA